MDEAARNPDMAFYYPNPSWSDPLWAKTMLLFFDGIALLTPTYMRDRVLHGRAELAGALHDRGLLKILEPEAFIDRAATEALASRMTDYIVSGALDRLASEHTDFHTLSYSRLGGMADAGLADMIVDELEKRGLARRAVDGRSIEMQPMVRSLILVLLSQILSPNGRAQQLNLWPATDRPEVHSALDELLALPSMPSAGRVVSLDFEAVDVDLRGVPLDQILAFRKEHGCDFRAYMRDVRETVLDLSLHGLAESERILRDRREAIDDTAAKVRKASRRLWRKGGSLWCSLTGAAWNLATGNLVGAFAGGIGSVLGADQAAPSVAGAYSYLFETEQRFAPPVNWTRWWPRRHAVRLSPPS